MTFLTAGQLVTGTSKAWLGNVGELAKASHSHGAGDITSGTLGIAQGGTGKTTSAAASNAFINALSVGENTPVDADYYISQAVNGGTTTTTYYRRPHSALYNYIKGKTDNLYASSSHNHAASNITSGTLGVARGGTGKASWTANRLMYPSAATTMTQLSFPNVNGSVLCQDISGAPYWKSPSDFTSDNIAESINRSNIAIITSDCSVKNKGVKSNVNTINTVMLCDGSTSYTKRYSDTFTITGTGGYSKRLRIAFICDMYDNSGSGIGNCNWIFAYFTVAISGGSTYTTAKDLILFDLYDTDYKRGIYLDIIQPQLNTLTATVTMYAHAREGQNLTNSGIRVTDLWLEADAMTYM